MAIPFDNPPSATVDHKTMYELLLLEEKLRGHPHLAASKQLVDAQLIALNESSKAAAAKMLTDANARAAVIEAKRVHDAEIAAAAGPAHARLDEAEAEKRQIPLDQKTVQEADAAAKARQAELDRQRQANEAALRPGMVSPAPGPVGPPRDFHLGPPARPDGMPSPSHLPPKPEDH